MSNGAHATVVLGFFAIVSTPVIAGIVANRDLHQRAVAEVREDFFRTSCATYKDMTTWERWSTPLGWQDGWCDDYLHRM